MQAIKKTLLGIVAGGFLCLGAGISAQAANPLLPLDDYTPDVEARMFTNSKGEERLYLYGSHDEYGSGTWCSHQYHVWSAPLDDLENWTDHGVSLASKTGEGYIWDGKDTDGISWNDSELYAPDVIKIGDTYYLITCSAGGSCLGVSTSKNPEGPFSPAQKIVYDDGKDTSSIDPSIYVEGEGENQKVYLYWGQRYAFSGEGLHAAELTQDENGIYRIVKRDTDRIIMGGKDDHESGFYEGASVRKINGKYYLLYPSDKGKGVHMMSYAMADEPLGPYKYTGNILDNDGCDLEGGNCHGSFCEINGQWYLFYHRGFGNSNYQRKVCAEKIYFDENGKIGDINGNQVQMTNHGLGGPLSPYEKIEAAYATHVRLDGFKSGCYLTEKSKDLHPLINITDGNCVEYRDFDFGQEKKNLTVSADILPLGGGSMDIILDDPQNAPVGTLIIPSNTSGEYTTLYADIPAITGVHTVYLKFHSQQKGNICELASYQFQEIKNSLHEDFSAGLENWRNADNASIKDGILTLFDNQDMESAMGEDWTNYSIDVRAAIQNGQAGIVFRKQDTDTYYTLEVKEDAIVLKKSVNGIIKTIGQIDEVTAAGEFHNYRIECVGNMLSIYKDGVWKETFRDSSIVSGKAGLCQQEGTSAQYDSIYVSENLTRRDWIEVNGEPLAGFSPEQKAYTIRLKDGAKIPQVRAYSTDKDVKVEVTQADAVPGEATIAIGEQTYTIQFQTVIPMSMKSNDFAKDGVGDFWEVLNPNPDNVSYKEGEGLMIQTEKGDLGNAGMPAKNIYLQKADGDWTIETVLSSDPAFGQIGGNWPSAGLVVYGDDGSYVKLVYLPGGVELNTSKGEKEQLPVSLNDPNQKLYLKLEKTGNQYTAYYSLEGKDKYQTFSGTRTMEISGIKAGLVTTGFTGDAQTKVTFREFTATEKEQSMDNLPELIPADGIQISNAEISMLNGSAASVEAKVLPENATYKDVVWSVEEGAPVQIVQGADSDVVTLQGIGTGEAVLTASLKEKPDVKANCTVTVRNPMVESVVEPEPLVNIVNGTPLEKMPFPKEVVLNTESGQIRAAVDWDLEHVNYDVNSKKEQKFQVEGKVTVPDGIDVPEKAATLTTKIDVTVSAAKTEVPDNPDKGNQGSNTTTGKAARTGDTNAPATYLLLALGAVAAVLGRKKIR